MSTLINATNPQLKARLWRTNPNHHLWNNNGTWFIHYTLHHGWTKERVRTSLQTHDLQEARQKRDNVFQAFSLAGRRAT